MMKTISDLLLRLGGLALLALAAVDGLRLMAIGAGHEGQEPARVYLLALIGFLLASAGSALLVNGRRLFDRIAVSGHWARDR
jgi:hypothetical protein